jgi:hypothetical protein
MPSPFPGIDPYLEHPDFWQETHHWLISLIAESLVPQIRPKYEIAIEKRIYQINDTNDNNDDSLLVGIPDVAIKRQPNTPDVPTGSVAIATLTVPTTVKVPAPEKIKQNCSQVFTIARAMIIASITIEILYRPCQNKIWFGQRNFYKQLDCEIINSILHY